MPNFIVVDLSDVPTLGSASSGAIWRVTAADAAAACDAVAQQMRFEDPHTWFVTNQTNVVRYVTTPNYSTSSTPG